VFENAWLVINIIDTKIAVSFFILYCCPS